MSPQDSLRIITELGYKHKDFLRTSQGVSEFSMHKWTRTSWGLHEESEDYSSRNCQDSTNKDSSGTFLCLQNNGCTKIWTHDVCDITCFNAGAFQLSYKHVYNLDGNSAPSPVHVPTSQYPGDIGTTRSTWLRRFRIWKPHICTCPN